jgi:hypothetical protein
MGGLALRRYLADYADSPVRTAITLATPHRGTWLAWLGWGQGAREMRPDSQFLRDLSSTAIPPHVRLICMRAPFDTRLFPASSAWLAGAECDTLRGSGHRRILAQSRVCNHIADMLAP